MMSLMYSLHQVYAKRSALRDGRSTVVVYRASSTADRDDILYHLIANYIAVVTTVFCYT